MTPVGLIVKVDLGSAIKRNTVINIDMIHWIHRLIKICSHVQKK